MGEGREGREERERERERDREGGREGEMEGRREYIIMALGFCVISEGSSFSCIFRRQRNLACSKRDKMAVSRLTWTPARLRNCTIAFRGKLRNLEEGFEAEELLISPNNNKPDVL